MICRDKRPTTSIRDTMKTHQTDNSSPVAATNQAADSEIGPTVLYHNTENQSAYSTEDKEYLF